ncbi:MAG: helix-turn-helix domain-containing protein [Candidatus Altiarchaeota archaeon]|nr:helix-turn-helix domain-containing protein [Candidatus Altiarchaeota archaeon]
MKLPCEKALWYTLPRIRAELAKELVKKGVSQNEAAEKLGITPSAVSQYLHKKRGEHTKLSAQEKTMIEKAAKEIMEVGSEKVVSKLICQCCRKIND